MFRSQRGFRDESVFTAAFTKQIVDSIDTRPQAHFCLKEMSSVVGCSPSHFTRLFSDLIGMTPAKDRKQFRRRVG